MRFSGWCRCCGGGAVAAPASVSASTYVDLPAGGVLELVIPVKYVEDCVVGGGELLSQNRASAQHSSGVNVEAWVQGKLLYSDVSSSTRVSVNGVAQRAGTPHSHSEEYPLSDHRLVT